MEWLLAGGCGSWVVCGALAVGSLLASGAPRGVQSGRRGGKTFSFFQAEDGIRDLTVTGVQTCALPISLHVNLQLLAALLQMGEPSLAHQPDGHDAPGHAHVHARIFQLLRCFVRVFSQDLRDCVREFVLPGIGLLPESFNLLELVAPQFVYFLVECQIVPYSTLGQPLPQADVRKCKTAIINK